MKATKITDNLKFTMQYSDGTKREIEEGVLFSFHGNKIETHIGTNNPFAISALVAASMEVVTTLGLEHLAEDQLTEDAKQIARNTLYGLSAEDMEYSRDNIYELLKACKSQIIKGKKIMGSSKEQIERDIKEFEKDAQTVICAMNIAINVVKELEDV